MGEKMGLKVHDQIEDSLDDEVGLCLRKLHANQTRTAVKIELFEQLMTLTKRGRYLRFTGDYRDTTSREKGKAVFMACPWTNGEH